ncbi:RNA methyltransferase [Aureococcus anophagefferens]|uniref:16S rRNA (uracil(1498)-N(3))-methyltransferase n=1 Tax=Aureococcus anophagefferens TaxID=44056 RepID=A0ABR1GE72_AURAN
MALPRRALAAAWCCTVAVALAPAPHTNAPRLWLGDDRTADAASVWELSPAQHRYVATVMRLREGDALRCFGAAMGEWACAKRTSLLIEKAVELGATRLAPVKTERVERASLAALGAGIHASAVERRSSRARLRVPVVEDVVDLASPLGDLPLFVCAERADGASPRLLDAPPRRGSADGAALLVGPEGGFSDADLAAVRASNPDATFVSLGAGILRAETACWAGLAVAAPRWAGRRVTSLSRVL